MCSVGILIHLQDLGRTWVRKNQDMESTSRASCLFLLPEPSCMKLHPTLWRMSYLEGKIATSNADRCKFIGIGSNSHSSLGKGQQGTTHSGFIRGRKLGALTLYFYHNPILMELLELSGASSQTGKFCTILLIQSFPISMKSGSLTMITEVQTEPKYSQPPLRKCLPTYIKHCYVTIG